MMSDDEIENIEIKLLLSAVMDVYGYDFRDYATASLKRRIENFMSTHHAKTYLALADQLIHDSDLFEQFLKNMSITVSEMFRDPLFYKSFVTEVIPVLKTYPFLKLWCAGCATGEEVYSLAIVLHEEGLLEKSTLYATDFNNDALRIAKKGIYSSEKTKEYIKNYNKFGGKSSFSEYYTAEYDSIKLADFLIDKITFANHNLVTDGSFGEMNVIFCRNVLIYFNQELTNKVLNLFCDSLSRRGYLCLGTKEALDFSAVYNRFDCIDKPSRIYQLR